MILRTGNWRTSRSVSARAFTLVELMVVMALLLIVLSVAFPSLKNFFHGRTLDSEARRLLSLTRYAQSRAVSESLPMVLWIDARQRTYGLQAQSGYLANDTKAVDYQMDDALELEVSAPPANPLLTQRVGTTTSVAGNLPAIRFTPDGYIGETSPETIEIHEARDRQSAIRISQDGSRLKYEIQLNQGGNTR